MYYVEFINDYLFWVCSGPADYQYIVELSNREYMEEAMEIAEREAFKYGNVSELEGTEEYDYYFNVGYVEVVKNALEDAGIEAYYYTEIDTKEK